MNDNFDYKNGFYNILDAIPVHIYWKDTTGRYLGCNKLMAKTVGLSREEIIGKMDDDLIWKDAAKDAHQIEQIVIRNRAKYEVEETSTFGTSNKCITYLSTKTPLYGLDGEVIGIIGVSVDITDRKKAEQLQKEKDIAERISQVMEMLAGSIAHEIRTPLGTIDMNIGMLQEAERKKEDISGFVNKIKGAVKRSGNIIDMLLVKLRNVLAGQISNHKFECCAIKSCINEVLDEYHFHVGEHESIVWDDKANEDFIYTGDHLFTKHVLFNLIKNALRAIKEVDRGKIYINLSLDRECNRLLFKDTAIGMPAEIRKHLFQSFKSNSRGGTGLGLAFCKMTMESYGGDITCDSKEGEYTEFSLNFPKVKTAIT